MPVNTRELIQQLKKIKPDGYEVSLKMGLITLTKYVFYRRNRFYYFSTEQCWNLSWENGYTEIEFKNNFENYTWHLDQIIS